MRMSSKQTPVTGSCIVHNVIACLRDGYSTQRMERRLTGSMYAEWHNDIPVHHKGILHDQWASLWRQILAEDSPCVCKFKLSRHTCRSHSWHRLDTENRHVWHGPLPLLSHVASCTSAYTCRMKCTIAALTQVPVPQLRGSRCTVHPLQRKGPH